MSESSRGAGHVGRDEAERIATLARLKFDDEELARITEELNRILDHVEELRSLERREVAEPARGDRLTVRGPDADRPDALRRDIASFAPDWRDGYFVVPPLPGMHAQDHGEEDR